MSKKFLTKGIMPIALIVVAVLAFMPQDTKAATCSGSWALTASPGSFTPGGSLKVDGVFTLSSGSAGNAACTNGSGNIYMFLSEASGGKQTQLGVQSIGMVRNGFSVFSRTIAYSEVQTFSSTNARVLFSFEASSTSTWGGRVNGQVLIPIQANAPPPPTGSCKVTRVNLEQTTYTAAEATVPITVSGTDCAGQQVFVELWNDATGADRQMRSFAVSFPASGDLKTSVKLVGSDWQGQQNIDVYAKVQSIKSNTVSIGIPPRADTGGGGPGTGGPPGPPGKEVNFDFEIKSPSKYEDIMSLVAAVSNYVFNLAIPIAVIMIIYAGIRFLLSQGNPAEYGKAKSILLYAVIGLSIVLIGKGFVSLINSVLDLGGTGSTTQQQTQQNQNQLPVTGQEGDTCDFDTNCAPPLLCLVPVEGPPGVCGLDN